MQNLSRRDGAVHFSSRIEGSKEVLLLGAAIPWICSSCGFMAAVEIQGRLGRRSTLASCSEAVIHGEHELEPRQVATSADPGPSSSSTRLPTTLLPPGARAGAPPRSASSPCSTLAPSVSSSKRGCGGGRREQRGGPCPDRDGGVSRCRGIVGEGCGEAVGGEGLFLFLFFWIGNNR